MCKNLGNGANISSERKLRRWIFLRYTSPKYPIMVVKMVLEETFLIFEYAESITWQGTEAVQQTYLGRVKSI